MIRAKLTLERLKALLEYNPETGDFIRLVTVSNKCQAGHVAGSFTADGYRQVIIDRVNFRANRLAWFYMTGTWPSGEVDHINRVRDDDKWSNLRDVSRTVNQRNIGLSKSNTSGYKGVSFERSRGKWRAAIRLGDGKRKIIGRFETAIQAYEAYCQHAKLIGTSII